MTLAPQSISVGSAASSSSCSRSRSTAIILFAGLTIDGGYAFAQRRGSQNASDFAALAGARVIAEWVGGDTTNGTDANVEGRHHEQHRCERRHAAHVRVPEWAHLHQVERNAEWLRRLYRCEQDPVGTVGVSVSLEPELEAVLPRHHRDQQLDGQLNGDGEGWLLAGRTPG